MPESQHTQTERGERCSCDIIHPVVCGGIVLTNAVSVYNDPRTAARYEEKMDEWGIKEDED